MVIFETSTFEFVNLPNFLQNKNLKFGTKITWFGCFRDEIWTKCRHIWSQNPQIFQNAKARGKQNKKIKFGTLNASFGYLISYLQQQRL